LRKRSAKTKPLPGKKSKQLETRENSRSTFDYRRTKKPLTDFSRPKRRR